MSRNHLSGDRERRVAVVLFQLGGPDSLEAVEPFLYNLFLDPDIIDFPFAKLARQPLAKLMASSRARKVQAGYAAIGGKSPIVEWTHRQAQALEEALRRSLAARVLVAMRYWHPFTEEAIEELAKGAYEELILLPLYPHFSKTTTGSSLNEWKRRFDPSRFPGLAVRLVQEFFSHPGYIESLVEKINDSLRKFPAPGTVHLVFSAHGVPTSVIAAGDPYKVQIEETTRLVLEKGCWPLPHTLCYQSKVGSGRWLQPSIHEIAEKLPAQGVRDMLVVPISFVSDHIETLSEIDREVREQALHAGCRQFEMMPGLNDSPKFIASLADMVLEAVSAPVAGEAAGQAL